MPNPCRQRSFWARIKLSKQKILYEPKFIFLSCPEKPDMLFYCCVFNEVFRFFALLRPLWSKLVLLTGSSHYSNFQGTHRRKNRRIIHIAVKPQRIIRWSNQTSVFICYPFNGFHLKRICVMPQNLFFFWMINMLCFAWSLNLSHISHLSSRFSNFFRFFSTCVIRKIFLRRASCFIAYQNALLRIFQLFENLLEEHRAFLQN